MAFSGSQKTRFSLYAGYTRPAGDFSGKTPAPSVSLIAQFRSSFRGTYMRVFGRVN